jgi:hypothetical protein
VLQVLFERLAIDPRTELFLRPDDLLQSGPDPKSQNAPEERTPPQASGLTSQGIWAGQ